MVQELMVSLGSIVRTHIFDKKSYPNLEINRRASSLVTWGGPRESYNKTGNF